METHGDLLQPEMKHAQRTPMAQPAASETKAQGHVRQHLPVANNNNRFSAGETAAFNPSAAAGSSRKATSCWQGPAAQVRRGQWTHQQAEMMFWCFPWHWTWTQCRESSCEESCTNVRKVKCKCCFLVTGQCREPHTGRGTRGH